MDSVIKYLSKEASTLKSEKNYILTFLGWFTNFRSKFEQVNIVQFEKNVLYELYVSIHNMIYHISFLEVEDKKLKRKVLSTTVDYNL